MAHPLNLDPTSTDALVRAAMEDRIIGTLFGSAVGDAVGLYTEFLTSETSAQAYPSRKFALSPVATPFYRDHHRSLHHHGEWTDDTDHALLILLSYLHGSGQKEPSPQDLAERLSVWVQMGLRALDSLPLGLGRTVGSVVRAADYLANPEARAREVWTKGGYNVAPNGSLMRTHPLGLICVHKTQEETFRVAKEFSVVTHVDPRCIVACVVGTALVRGLVRGEVRTERDVDVVIEAGREWFIASHEKELEVDEARKDEPRLDLAEFQAHTEAKSLKDLELDARAGIGYVYKCLGSGILLLRLAMREVEQNPQAAFHVQLTIFEKLMTDLVMSGGDADTNACFAGALLGAYLGFKTLPPHWRDGLRYGDWLLAKAHGLCETLGVVTGSGYNGSEDPATAPDGGRGFLTEKEMERRFMEHQAWMAQCDTEHKAKAKEKSGWRKSLFSLSK